MMENERTKTLKEDYDKRTFLFAFLSFLTSLAFAFYNGALGIIHSSILYGSFAAYYILLIVLRLFILQAQLFSTLKNKPYIQEKAYYISFVLLLLFTLAMVPPVVMLALNKREYNLGLIPAIVYATYTTYSVTMAVINLKKSKKTDNLLTKQLRLINFIYALMSVLTLQNTLILAVGGFDEDMYALSACTSGAILLGIIAIVVVSFVLSIKKRQ